MRADQLDRGVQDAHHARVPTNPYVTSHVLLGHVVESSFDDDVAIATHFAAAFLVAGKQTRGERPQGGLLIGKEMFLDLSLGRYLYPQIGDVGFPDPEVFVQIGEALEDPPFELAFEALDIALYLALVLRASGTRWHDCRIVVASEGQQLRIDFRVMPVSLQNRRLEVVRTQACGNPAEVAKRVLQPPYEALRILAKHRLAVDLARKRQGNAKQLSSLGPTVLALDEHHRSVVDLGLFAGLDLHPPYPLGVEASQRLDESLDRSVRTLERRFALQILVDALGVQAAFELRFDRGPKGLAFARPTRAIAGHRNGTF